MRSVCVRLGVLIGGGDSSTKGVRALGHAICASVEHPFKTSARLIHVAIELAEVRVLPALPAADLLERPLTLARAAQWLESAANAILVDAQPLEDWRIANRIDAVLITLPLQRKGSTRSILGAAHLPVWRRGVPSFARVALVDSGAAADRYAAAHEFGHLLGLQHAAEWQSVAYIDDIAQSAAHKGYMKRAGHTARGWQCPDLRLQTIMGDMPTNGHDAYTTVPVWSEPGIDWFGNRTTATGPRARGCANLADEVSYLREVLPKFVAWRSAR